MSYTFSGSNRSPVGATTGYSTSNPVTGSITINPRDTLLTALIIYSGGGDRTGGAPSFNGHTMSQADTARRGATSPEVSTELWYITASGIGIPVLTGSEVSVPNGGGVRVAYDLVTAYPKPGKTSVLQVATGSAVATTSTNPYCRITTTAGSTIIFEVVANGANTWAPTGRTATFVNINDNDIGNYGGGMMYSITDTVGIITGSWIFGTGEDWGVVMAAFGEMGALIYLQNATQTQTASSPTLTAHTPQYSAVAQNCTQAQIASSVGVLSAHYSLTVFTDLKQAQAVDSVTLTQHQVLAVASPTQTHSSENITLTQNYRVIVASPQQNQTADNITLTPYAPSAQLVIDSSTQVQIVSSVSLNAHYTISNIENTTQGQIVSFVSLNAHYTITILNNATQAQSVSEPTLTYHVPTYNAVAQDCAQAQTVSTPTLSAHYSITVQIAQQIQSVSGTTLSSHYSITIQIAEQAQTASKPVLNAQYSITVQVAQEIQTTSSIALSQHYSGLAIGYASQLQTATSVALLAAYSISTDSATMIQVAAIITFATGGLTRQMMHYARMRRK